MRNQYFHKSDSDLLRFGEESILKNLGYPRVRKNTECPRNLSSDDIRIIKKYFSAGATQTADEIQTLFYRDESHLVISEKEADIIVGFINDLSGKISPGREYIIISSLFSGRQYMQPYTSITTAEAQAGIKHIFNAVNPDGTPRYKKNSIMSIINIQKRLLLWMCENGYGDNLNEKKINAIKVPSPDKMTKTAADILTEEEVKAILSATKNSRDRAIISVLYEGGLRGRELAELTWNDVHFTEWNVSINTAGKTGAPRYIPLVSSRSYLAQWKNDYPGDSSNPENFVFTTLKSSVKGEKKYRPLAYTALCYIITEAAKDAGVTKHLTPHIFRHSRITHLIQHGVPETHIKKMMWGNITTDMFRTYAHIVNDDLDDSIAELYGISRQEEAEKKKHEKVMEPRQCKKCGFINGPTINFCGQCGAPLTEEGKTEVETDKGEAIEIMRTHPEMFYQMFTQFLATMDKKNQDKCGH